MRCQICNSDNGSVRKNPDGSYDCICAACMTVIYDCLRHYKTIENEKDSKDVISKQGH